jgi:hypothetical protein
VQNQPIDLGHRPYDPLPLRLLKSMRALWGKMGMDLAGQHGILALLANNHAEFGQMDELVHDKQINLTLIFEF